MVKLIEIGKKMIETPQKRKKKKEKSNGYI